LKKTPKENEDDVDVGRKRQGREKVETQAQAALSMGLDQITKFVYPLDEPLGEGNV
jgi:hypothetical protein